MCTTPNIALKSIKLTTKEELVTALLSLPLFFYNSFKHL
jgi:hypothetical protein